MPVAVTAADDPLLSLSKDSKGQPVPAWSGRPGRNAAGTLRSAEASLKPEGGRFPPAPLLLLILSSSFVSSAQSGVPTPLLQVAAAASTQASAPARLSGEIQSQDGATIAGAQVTLVPAAGTAGVQTRTVTSDAAGQFLVGNLGPGTYSLSVHLSGFSALTEDIHLGPGQEMVLAPLKLSLETVNISVDAITPEQAGLEQLHLEEHQRLVGLLPNFFVSYKWTAPPLTSMQKYKLATHTVFDPGNLVLSGLVSGVQQADNAFPGYGQGVAGYSKRFGANLGNLVIGTYLGGAVLPSLFHQDPRYFYKGTGTKRARFFYAISRAVITRGDNGHEQPNFSGILGDLSSGALSNAYYPASDRQGATLFLKNSVLAIGGDALTGFVQEFVFGHFTLNNFTKRNKNQP